MIKVWRVNRAPEGAQYIGRSFGCYPQSPFHNPYHAYNYKTREECLIDFAIYWFSPAQKELRRRALLELSDNIMCWCEPKWCHGHIEAGYVEWVRRIQEEREMRDYEAFDSKNWFKHWRETDLR